MRPWIPTLLLLSVAVLGTTFVLTVYGPLSGGTLAAIYIGYAVLLAVGMVFLLIVDPRAGMSTRDAQFVTSANRAADVLAVHLAGVDRGPVFRSARAAFYERGRVLTPVLESYLLDGDEQTRVLTAKLLVARGPDVAVWAEDRIDELAEDATQAPVRAQLEKVVRLIRSEASATELEDVFR